MSTADTARDVEQRLSEALATIDALISGQVDAVLDAEGKSPLLLTRAQETLRQSEERYRRIVETTHEGIATLDPKGRITFVNRRLTEMFQYPEQKMHGKLLSYFMAAGPEAGTAVPAVANENQEILEQRVRYLRKDGSELWVLLRMSPIRDADGRFIGALAMLMDKTHSIVAEEALRKSEEQYRQIVETTSDGIIKINTHRKIEFVNRRFAEMLGYEPAAMIQRSVFEFMSAAAKRTAESSMKRRKAGETKAVNTTFRHQNGRDIAVNLAGSVILDEAGRYIGYLAAVRDITEQNKLEEQLRQSQKMDAVGQLAGGMAHDFNNLLTVINGYSELAITQLQPDNPLQNAMEQIKKAGTRAAALTRQLLAFSRKQILMPTVVDLNELISELEKMLQRLIGEDVLLRTKLAPDTGSIKADRGQIEQVVMNLVINARDAMPSGGELTLETHNVDLTEDFSRQHLGVSPGAYVMLAVSDTGVGMSAETKARIFEPFFTTKEAGKGTGLGLSTVYGILQQSGGSIWVYTELGRGTTFKVYLPHFADDSLRSRPTNAPRGGKQGTETILLTEDDEMVRTLATKVLTGYGYQVLTAANGREAISIVEHHSHPIHLLITDVVMPGMHGRDLADRLTALRPELRVLFMSGYTDRAIVHEQFLDEKTFIQKPFSPQRLASKIREILDEACDLRQ
jgi:two-component system cell cycle sensor histidine kinase/response regulator CckA